MPPPDLQFHTASEKVDIPWLFNLLHHTYWGQHYTLNSVMRAVDGSLCFSAMVGDQQVGFARIVTDGAITSMLNDVVVDEKWRGRGICTALLTEVFAHRRVAGTICLLQTRYASKMYNRFGFSPGGEILKRNPTI